MTKQEWILMACAKLDFMKVLNDSISRDRGSIKRGLVEDMESTLGANLVAIETAADLLEQKGYFNNDSK